MKRTKYPKKSNVPTCPTFKQDPREIHFVHEYLTDLDMEGAAIRARLISSKGTKEDRIDQAVAIFNRPSVQSYLQEAVDARVERTKVTADRAIRELSRVAFSDPLHLVSENDGTVRALKDMPVEIRVCIKEMVQESMFNRQGEFIGLRTKVKLHDKAAALRTILQHLGMLAPETPTNGMSINYTAPKAPAKGLGSEEAALPLRLDVFSDEELRLLSKMTGNYESEEVIDLEVLEAEFAEMGFEERAE